VTLDWVDWLAIGLAVVTFCFGVAAVISYRYVRRVVGDSIDRSRELRRLVYRNRRVALAGFIIAALIAYTLLRLSFPEAGMPVIQPPWTSITIAVVLDLLLWGVIADAIAFYRLRRDGPVDTMDGSIASHDIEDAR
jgi:hypothetical protein